MRLFLLALLLALPILALPQGAFAGNTSPSCEVNTRFGMSVAARTIPEGRVLTAFSAGDTVEVVTVTNDSKGCPWVLIRPPGQDWYSGWVDRRAVTCGSEWR